MNSITIDSSHCITDLCILCAQSGTDKTPLNPNGHRHPYTTPYSLLLEPLRKKQIKFAEIGVFRGASLLAWRRYFERARIYGFDNHAPNLEFINSQNWPGVYVRDMDASNPQSIHDNLKYFIQDGELFDVILDDASHNADDQVQVIRTAIHFIKQGGLLIVEDIFREASIEKYQKALEDIKPLVSFHTFIVCDHKDRFSGTWNNDKLLVFVRA